MFTIVIYLNFDIISLTFQKGAEEIVIPVSMSPIDIVPTPTPPIFTTSDRLFDLRKILALIFIVALFVVLWWFIKILKNIFSR